MNQNDEFQDRLLDFLGYIVALIEQENQFNDHHNFDQHKLGEAIVREYNDLRYFANSQKEESK